MWRDYSFSGEDIELFRMLIPDYCLKALAEGDLEGTVYLDPDRYSSPVVGIVIYRISDGCIEIEWAATTKEYDLPHHGTDMIHLFVNKARISGNYRGVYCRFREGDQIARFFPEEEFEWAAEKSSVYYFSLSDVGEITRQTKHAKMENCIPLKDADHAAKNSLLDSPEALPIPHPVDWNIYEQEVSAFYTDKDKAEGVILVEKNKDELVIRLLYSENPVVAITLLEYAFGAATEKYGEEQMVACPVLNGMSDSLVKKIVRDAQCQEFIRAKASFTPGTGTMTDFVKYAPLKTGSIS